MSQSRYRNRRRHNNTNSGTGIASDTGLDVTIMPRAPISPRPSPLAREFVPGLSAETRASPATPQNPQQRVAAQAALQTPEALARDPAQVPGSPTVQQAPRSSVSTRTRSRVNIPPAQLSCKFFRAGYCARGDTCWFKHEAPTSPAPVEPPDATSPAPASGASDDEAEPCAICFDKPETFGLMTGCNHVFCLGRSSFYLRF